MKPQPIPNRHSIRLKGYDYSQAGLYFITLCCQDRLPLFGQIVRGNNAPAQMILNNAGHIADKCWLEIPMHYPNVILHEYVIMPNHIHGIIEIVGANNYSPANDTNNHSPAYDANNHLPVNDTNNHSPITITNNHSPANDANIDSPITITNNHSPVNDTNNHSPANDANNHSPEIVANHSPETIVNDSTVMNNDNYAPENVANNDIRAKDISPLPPPPTSSPSPPNGTSKTIGAMVRGFKIGVTKWMRQNTTVHDVWQRNYYEHIIRNEQSYVRIAKYIINNPVNWQEDKFYKQ
jgi:putative transposase